MPLRSTVRELFPGFTIARNRGGPEAHIGQTSLVEAQRKRSERVDGPTDKHQRMVRLQTEGSDILPAKRSALLEEVCVVEREQE